MAGERDGHGHVRHDHDLVRELAEAPLGLPVG
jgi:hypothetical protein